MELYAFKLNFLSWNNNHFFTAEENGIIIFRSCNVYGLIYFLENQSYQSRYRGQENKTLVILFFSGLVALRREPSL